MNLERERERGVFIGQNVSKHVAVRTDWMEQTIWEPSDCQVIRFYVGFKDTRVRIAQYLPSTVLEV